jgi:hypothetical protein
MIRKILLIACIAVGSISKAAAQDVTGHWTGRIMDQFDVAYDFKVDGNTLTGKNTHPDGSVTDISNGKINADSLSFDTVIRSELTHIKGKLAGDVLTLGFGVQGNDVTVDLKKTTSK